jgi:hypothetical protein
MVASMAPKGALPPGGSSFMQVVANAQLRGMAYKLVRALKAAGRDDEAKQIADAASAADGSAEMAAALEGRYTAPTPEQIMALAGDS